MSHPTDSAFPVQRQLREDGEVLAYAEAGLTKREYFAGLAMQGLAPRYASGNHSMATLAAKLAVESADALLAELAKQPVG